jgi:hypothetical protein
MGFIMILEIFRDSFEYTFKDSTILKLGILSLLSFLIIPIFILAGYSYRTIFIGINSMINKNNRKPTFKGINEILIQGIKTIIIALIYNILSIIITYFFIGHGYVFKVVKLVGESRIDFNLEFVALLAVLWFISLLFTSVAIPYMIDNNGSLKAGIEIKKILAIIKNVGILNYVKFSIASLIVYTGILIIMFLMIQIIISLFVDYGISMTGTITIMVFIFVSLFLIIPIFLLSQSRAISLIYNIN